MARRANNQAGRRVVIIRRTEAAEESHHGGAWKIAYADFVTAMMAFFLLMWLVNATTEAQRRGIADYFAPTNPMGKTTTGSGQPFGGRTLASDGRMIADGSFPVPPRMDPQDAEDEAEEEQQQPEPPRRAVPVQAAAAQAASTPVPSASAGGPQDDGAAAAEERQQRAVLRQAAEEIRAAVLEDPQLAALARQLIIEEVPEGLRVQVVDSEGQAVFATGQAAPNERGRALLQRAAAVIARLPHPVEVTGHTDAAPFRGGGERSNWELSAERANATRRLLLEAGIAEARLHAVAGRADRELLRPEEPLDPANRRVSVLVLIPRGAGDAPAR